MIDIAPASPGLYFQDASSLSELTDRIRHPSSSFILSCATIPARPSQAQRRAPLIMIRKFYAVRRGRRTGIFLTWK